MKSELLRDFITLSECLNYRKAADRLYMSQSVLSRHIIQLERELGFLLFRRNKHAVELTGEGKMFLDGVKEILDQYIELNRSYQALVSRISSDGSGRVNSLTVGLLNYAKDHLTPFIDRFQEIYPDCRIRFLSKTPIELHQALESDEVDVCQLMHIKFKGSERLRFLDFSEEQIMFIVNHQHPLKGTQAISVRELKDERFIFIDDALARDFYSHVAKLIAKHDVQIDKHPILVKSFEALLDAILACAGVAIVINTMPNVDVPAYGTCLDIKEKFFIKQSLVFKRDNHNMALKAFLEEALAIINFKKRADI